MRIAGITLLLTLAAGSAAWATTPPVGTATRYNDIGQFDIGTGLMQSCVAMLDGQGNAQLDATGKPVRYAVQLRLRNPQLEFDLFTFAAFDTSKGKDCSGSFRNGVFSDNVLVSIPADPLDGKVVKVTLDLLSSNLDFRLRTDAQSFGIVRNFTGNSTSIGTGTNLGAFQQSSVYDFTNALPPSIKLKMPTCNDLQGDDNKVVLELDGSVLATATPGSDYTLATAGLGVGDHQLKAYCSDESAIRAIATAAGMTSDSKYFAVSAYATGTLKLKVPASASTGNNGSTGGNGGSSSTGQLSYQFDSGTSASEQQLIQQAANFARDFFTAQFGRTLQKTSNIITISTQTGGCSGAGASAFTGSQNLTICTGNQGWTVHDSTNRQKIIIHEMFHLLQFELKWAGNQGGNDGPRWLVEGTAEYIGWLGIANFSSISPALPLGTARGCMARDAANYNTNLSALESAQAFQGGPVYQQSMLGVDQLISGSSVNALLTYGTALGNGTAYDSAFQTAFGTPLTTFYGQFLNYKAGLTVPATAQCGI